MRLLQPSSMVQVSKKNPDRFVKRALKIVRTGFGQPSIFNTDAIVQELVRQGKSIEDAREGGASGCVEAGAFGREAYFLTGYFNLPKVLEITLHDGIDPAQRQTPRARHRRSGRLRQLRRAVRRLRTASCSHFIDIKIRGNNLIEHDQRPLHAGAVSLAADRRLHRQRDATTTHGGARYNTTYIQGVGLGTVTDGLTAIKLPRLSTTTAVGMADLLDGPGGRFRGPRGTPAAAAGRHPEVRQRRRPADDIMRTVFEAYFDADRRPAQRPRRGPPHQPAADHLPRLFRQRHRGPARRPQGRRDRSPRASRPVQGADRNGPTAVTQLGRQDRPHPHRRHPAQPEIHCPSCWPTTTGITKLAHLVRTYFRMDGHHIQFNVVDSATLARGPAVIPKNYRDLIVRVAGYSDYFVDLTEALQDEIIRRTAHAAV